MLSSGVGLPLREKQALPTLRAIERSVFDYRTYFCHSALMEADALGFKAPGMARRAKRSLTSCSVELVRQAEKIYAFFKAKEGSNNIAGVNTIRQSLTSVRRSLRRVLELGSGIGTIAPSSSIP